jgi:hypothetical protein
MSFGLLLALNLAAITVLFLLLRGGAALLGRVSGEPTARQLKIIRRGQISAIFAIGLFWSLMASVEYLRDGSGFALAVAVLLWAGTVWLLWQVVNVWDLRR